MAYGYGGGYGGYGYGYPGMPPAANMQARATAYANAGNPRYKVTRAPSLKPEKDSQRVCSMFQTAMCKDIESTGACPRGPTCSVSWQAPRP